MVLNYGDSPVLKKEGWKYHGSHNGRHTCPAEETSHEGICTYSSTRCGKNLISETDWQEPELLLFDVKKYDLLLVFSVYKAYEYSLIQQTFIELLMCARYCFVCLRYTQEQSRQKQLISQSLPSSVRRQKINK